MEKNETSNLFKTQVENNQINYMDEIDETLNHEQKKLMVTLSCQKNGYRYAEDKKYEHKLKNYYSKVNKSTSISELQSKYTYLNAEV